MEFDANFREDFPFLSNLFSDDNTPPKPELTDGFSLEPSASCKDSLFDDLHGHFDHFPLTGSNLNPHDHGDHFNVEGSTSNPLSGIRECPCTDPCEAYANAFLNDFTASLFASDSTNENMQGFESSYLSFWDNPDQKNLVQPTTGGQSHIYLPLNIQEHDGPSNGRFADDISCITAENEYNRKLAVQRKIRKRAEHMRKAGEVQKKPSMIKGQWTPQEDRLLLQLVDRFGTKKWSHIARMLNGRMGKQCRERWHNHLRPDIRKDAWSEEEDKILIEAHKEIGNKWAAIARRLPGRTENTIKNHWNATKRRQLSKKKSKDSDSNGSLLQSYIKSVTSASAPRIDKNINMLSASDKQMVSMMTKPRIDQLESSDLNSADWAIPVYNDHNYYEAMGLLFDKDMLPETHGFMSMLEEMPYSSLVEDSNMEYETPLETDNLVQGEVKKEMDLMELIYQGKL
ncbi:transcription factor MYB118 [Juglans microcarpa x Juglans regia]|uniref:transcription factor MYB118 n=1 Tax=Juglans microcarpa x Juglans regia TaxID=2249226 RepID=UPI001B7EBC79|nr:transcription factor MYB118 [Juglans microcarpa x Juglans regia]